MDVSGPDRMSEAFAKEESAALRWATWVRLIGISVVSFWLAIENGFPEVLFFVPWIAAFAVISALPWQLDKRGIYKPWHRYLFPPVELTLLVLVLLLPNPLSEIDFPPALDLRFGNEVYLFLFLSSAIFTCSPRFVLWTGFSASAIWSLAVLWTLSLPGTITEIPMEIWVGLTTEERLHALVDPNYVYIGSWVRIVIVLMLVSAGMAAAIFRLRRLVARESDAERRRANLSRYFSSNVVDELAEDDDPLGRTRQQHVGILFADIVGFTHWAELESPEAVIDLLREYHSHIEAVVFEHGGTLDKYIGDGVMVTFGTPRTGPRDASRTLRCALHLQSELDSWSRKREAAGQVPMKVGVGAHYGAAVVGDVGSDRYLEFTVVGDSVNVASRLEHLTREAESPLVVSLDLLDAARHQGGVPEAEFARFRTLESKVLRGRSGTISLCALTD